VGVSVTKCTTGTRVRFTRRKKLRLTRTGLIRLNTAFGAKVETAPVGLFSDQMPEISFLKSVRLFQRKASNGKTHYPEPWR
jgi:hypothetical protein